MVILLNSTATIDLRAVSGIASGTLYVRRDGTVDDLRVSANSDMAGYTNLSPNTEESFAGAAYALGWGSLTVSSSAYVAPSLTAGLVSVDVNPVTGGSGIYAGYFDVLAANGGVVDFVVLDGTIPTKAAKGKPIAFRANGAPVVASGSFLTSGAGTGTRAWYGEFEAGQRITRIGAEFKFTAGSGGKNGVVALIPWAASVVESGDIPPTPLHFTIGRYGWTVGVLLTTNGAITNIGAGSFATLDAGKLYSAEAVIDGDTAYLTLPDGSVATVTDPAIASVVGVFAGWEFFQFDGAVDDVVSIGRVWAGVSDQRVHGASALSAASRVAARRPVARTFTSIASSSIPESEALVDPSAIVSVPKGTANRQVLCRLTAWLNIVAGNAVIFSPLFKDVEGSTVSHPYIFAASPAAAYSGYVTVEFVQDVTSDFEVLCEFRYFSTGAGDTIDVAANKPMTMSFTPLG